MLLSIRLFCLLIPFTFQDYGVYHERINTAEIYITEGRINDALNIYTTLFNEYDKVFGKDYFNAALCAESLGKRNLTYKYLFELSKKGLSIEFIKKKPEFSALISSKEWQKFQKNYIKEYDKFYTKNISIRHELDALRIEDQRLRKERDSLGIPLQYSKLRAIDSTNVFNLLKIIDELGEYPGENIVGLRDSLDQPPAFDIVIWHQADNNNRVHNFSDMLREAMKRGNLLPGPGSHMIYLNEGGQFNFDYIYTMEYTGSDPLPEHLRKYMSVFLYKSKLVYDFEKINSFRKAHYLPSLADHIQKMFYEINSNNSFDFDPGGSTFRRLTIRDIPTIESLSKISSPYIFHKK